MIFPTTGEIAIIFTFLLSIYTAFLKVENNKKLDIKEFNTVMADITKLVDSLATQETTNDTSKKQ